MRNYEREFESRVRFIKEVIAKSGASGIVYGNSGGKDSALVGILCKAACPNTLGLIMPCSSKRNFDMDKDDGLEVAGKFGIETRIIDLTPQREAAVSALSGVTKLTDMAVANIAPRLRMITLYAVALSEGRIVAGTGNRSEAYMGYFTKWGDGAHDFNPIGDLTVTEIYEFLDYLDAPTAVRTKSPSAGLFEGQTDEGEMGITYAAIDRYLLRGEASETDRAVIGRYHERAKHKLEPIITFSE
jgi:NAD+ synthase